MNINMRKTQSGFTLIELVIVIVILGILAAVAIPRYLDLSTEAEEATCEGVVGALTSSAAIQVAATPIGSPTTRAGIIAATAIDGASVSSGAAGIIDVDVGDSSCSTPNLQTLGLSSD